MKQDWEINKMICEDITHRIKTNFNTIVILDLFSDNEYYRCIANILFISSAVETKNYIDELNEFDKKLKEQGYNCGSLNTVYRNSDMFKQIQKLYKCREFIKEHRNDDEFDIAEEKYVKYGYHMERITSLMNDTIDKLSTYFAYYLTLSKKNWIEMGGFNDKIEKFGFKHYD